MPPMEEKAAQYLRFGIEHIWAIDPESRKAYRYNSGKFQLVDGMEMAILGTPIRVVLAEMFAELDRK